MSYINRIVLLGNVGNAPEVLSSTNGDKKFVKVSMATSSSSVDAKGVKQVKTSWHTIYFNGRLAAVAEHHLQKGSRIYVAGKLDYKEWKDKNDEKHMNAFVIANQLILLDSKSKANGADSDEVDHTTEAEESSQNMDDLSF